MARPKKSELRKKYEGLVGHRVRMTTQGYDRKVLNRTREVAVTKITDTMMDVEVPGVSPATGKILPVRDQVHLDKISKAKVIE